MKQLLSVLIFVTGVIYIAFIEKEATFVSVFFKALPMFLLLIYAMINYRTVGKHLAIVIGLFVCMLADIAIAFSFLAGLSIFFTWSCVLCLCIFKGNKKERSFKENGYSLYGLCSSSGVDFGWRIGAVRRRANGRSSCCLYCCYYVDGNCSCLDKKSLCRLW